jgi:hypothetical protein
MRFWIVITLIIYGKYTYTGILEGWSLLGFIGAYVSLVVIMTGAMAAFLAICYVVVYIHHIVTTLNKSPDK